MGTRYVFAPPDVQTSGYRKAKSTKGTEKLHCGIGYLFIEALFRFDIPQFLSTFQYRKPVQHEI